MAREEEKEAAAVAAAGWHQKNKNPTQRCGEKEET